MEDSVYKVIAELYDYIGDPKRNVLNTTDRAHLEAVLKTLLVIYSPEYTDTPIKPVDSLQEARRPPRKSEKKPFWGWFG